MNIYLDIETVPLPLAQRAHCRPDPDEVPLGNLKDPDKIAAKIKAAIEAWESGNGAALDPLQARVALVGLAVGDGEYTPIYADPENDDSEVEVLTRWWESLHGLDQDRIRIIGHNIRFDAAMLIHRSWIQDVPVPSSLVTDLFSYSPHHWADTMRLWQLGDKTAKFTGLDRLCRSFGISVKTGDVTGADFWLWWQRDKPACIAYNRQDVEAVRQLWGIIGTGE